METKDCLAGRSAYYTGGHTPKNPSREWLRCYNEAKEEREKETLKDHQTDRRVFVEEREQREQEELRKLFPDSLNFNPSAKNTDDSAKETE